MVTQQNSVAGLDEQTMGHTQEFKLDIFQVNDTSLDLAQIDFGKTPDYANTVSTLDNPSGDFFRDSVESSDTVAVSAQSTIAVDKEGTYTFFIPLTDEVRLLINGDTGLPPVVVGGEMIFTAILDSGTNTFELQYFQAKDAPGIRLEWQGADTSGERTSLGNSIADTDDAPVRVAALETLDDASPAAAATAPTTETAAATDIPATSFAPASAATGTPDMSIFNESTQAQGNNNSAVSIGLTGIKSSGTQIPFIDLMKVSRPFLGHEPKDWGATANWELKRDGYLDENGWVKEIPEGLRAVGTIWNWDKNNASDSQKGVFVVSYEGEGTLKVGGESVKVLSQEDGKITFSNPTGGLFSLDITSTDPNKTGDYIRDISIVHESNVEIFEAGATFNPEWLDVVADSRDFRFMDWMNTNKSKISSFDGYPTEENANWSVVPVEVMVRLANEAGVNPWFNMPHTASDAFVREFAEYVRDNLDPNLTVRVEWSNEVWNSVFDVHEWAEAQATNEWGVSGYTGALDYQAKRATETALIWEDVFAQDADAPALVNVMGSRPGGDFSNTRVLTSPSWQTNEPDSYVAPHTVFDELAVTTYFGGTTVRNTDYRDELISVIQNPNIDATAWLAEKLMDPKYAQSIPQIANALSKSKALADQYGVDLVAYEGGQHVHHSFAVRGLSKADEAILTNFMTGFVRSPEMADLYSELFEIWSNVADGAFMQFGDVDSSDKYGSWAFLSNLDDTNPRAAFLMEQLRDATAWFEPANDAYLQGVSRTGTDGNDRIIGTDQEDFLAGGRGNDEFYAGLGKDGINGGSGSDRLYLTGSASEYTVREEGNGYVITGKDGEKFVVNVESIVFQSGETIELATAPTDDTTDTASDDTTTDDTTDDTTTDDTTDTTTDDTTDTTTDDTTDSGTDDTTSDETAGDHTEEPPREEQTPPVDSGVTVQVADGDLTDYDHTGDIGVASDNPESIGVLIRAINNFSTLGRELGLTGSERDIGYIVHDRQKSVSYTTDDGESKSVWGNYYALQENSAGKSGAQISDSATETALMFGDIIIDPASIHGSNLNDIIVGHRRNDIFYGEDGDDRINGKKGNDQLFGGEGQDRIDGNVGNDLITGGVGDDHLHGGTGSDRFFFEAGDGNDRIYDFEAGVDTLELEGFFANGETLASATTEVNGDTIISNGVDTITLLGIENNDLPWITIA